MNMFDTIRIISVYFKRAVVSKSVFGLTVLTLIFASCLSREETAGSEEKFPIVRPIKMDTVFAKEFVADIQSIQNVELRSRVSGFIEKIHVDEGQTVRAGQVLFSISSQVFRDELQKANALMKSAIAECKVAEVELKNTRRLVEKNIVSQTDLEMAEAKLEATQARIDEAKSAVSTAQLHLSFATVKAPFAGVINRIPNKIGSFIEEGMLLTTISNNSEVFTYFNMSEVEYLDFIRRNDSGSNKEVALIMANNQIYGEKGKIEIVESEIDKNTGTIAFRARFPNPSQVLKHGASGKIVLNTVLKDALLIPQKSTFEIQENLYVYVVNKDNMVELRSFIPGTRMSHVYVVQSGLSPEDKIIYEGIQRVREGDKIVAEQVSFGKSTIGLAQNK